MLRRRILAVLSILACAAPAMMGQQKLRRAPGFALPDVNMQWRDMQDYRGKVVVLEFMQTDCEHCATFAGVLRQVQQKYGDRIAILAVVNASHDAPPKVQAYIAGHRITYPVLYDQGQMEYSYLLKTSVQNPCVFLIDANGYIRNSWEHGPFTKQIFEGTQLFAEIDRLLGAPASKK